MRALPFVTIGIVAAAISCGGGSSSPTGTLNNPPPPPGGVNVTIQDFSFSPTTVTIKVGTTVQWVNDGPSEHSSVSDDGIWDSQGLAAPSGVNPYSMTAAATAGGTYQHTFNDVGTFTYHCKFHPPSAYPSFVGTIVVTN